MPSSPSVRAASVFDRADEILRRLTPDLIALRRTLHRHPELAWRERQTTATLVERLRALGLMPNPGPREVGCWLDLDNHAGPSTTRLALRADIDAIPVAEHTTTDYTSQIPGVMHACGHDVHATVLYGVLATLTELAADDGLDTPLKLRAVFQPAEEVAQGAAAVIDAGILDGVEAILAIHVDPSRATGRIGVRSGAQTARCDELIVTVRGQGGHGARPHETRDPILAAVQFVNLVYARLPRTTDSRQPWVLSFCKIQGGSSANVLPDSVELQGTIRTLDADIQAAVERAVRETAAGVAQATGTTIDVQLGVLVPSVVNDPDLVRTVSRAAESFLGADAVDVVPTSMGSEDFAFYTQRIPGMLIRVGTAHGQHGSAPLHSSSFDIDERAIAIACRLLVRSVLVWFNPALA